MEENWRKKMWKGGRTEKENLEMLRKRKSKKKD
jgi:hypothetical protein